MSPYSESRRLAYAQVKSNSNVMDYISGRCSRSRQGSVWLYTPTTFHSTSSNPILNASTGIFVRANLAFIPFSLSASPRACIRSAHPAPPIAARTEAWSFQFGFVGLLLWLLLAAVALAGRIQGR